MTWWHYDTIHWMTWWRDDTPLNDVMKWWRDDVMTWWRDDVMTWWRDDATYTSSGLRFLSIQLQRDDTHSLTHSRLPSFPLSLTHPPHSPPHYLTTWLTYLLTDALKSVLLRLQPKIMLKLKYRYCPLIPLHRNSHNSSNNSTNYTE